MSHGPPVELAVTNSDELNELYARYLSLAADGTERSLRIDLGPGVYGVASYGQIGLTLSPEPPGPPPLLDLTLRGPDSGPPAVFEDMCAEIQARSVRLENVVIRRRRSARALRLRAAKAIHLSGCLLIDNEIGLGAAGGGSLVELSGADGSAPCEVEISRSLFLRNSTALPGALVAIAPAAGSSLSRLSFVDTIFAGNHFAFEIAFSCAREVRVKGCWLHKPPAEELGPPAPALLVYDFAPGCFSIQDSVVICQRLGQLAAQQAGSPQPIEVTGCTLWVAEQTESPLLQLSGSTVRAGAAGRGAEVEVALGELARGPIPDPRAARARLQEAFAPS